MRGPGVFHPNFAYHPRPGLASTRQTKIKIYDLTPEAIEWVPGNEPTVTPDTLIWEGFGRFQPNKDWRARPREVQYEYDAIQAVRVQIPIGKNLVGAVYDTDAGRYTAYGEDPKFVKNMRVHVEWGTVKGFETMEGTDLYIRNAVQGQSLWQYNLLCDTKTGGIDER